MSARNLVGIVFLLGLLSGCRAAPHSPRPHVTDTRMPAMQRLNHSLDSILEEFQGSRRSIHRLYVSVRDQAAQDAETICNVVSGLPEAMGEECEGGARAVGGTVGRLFDTFDRDAKAFPYELNRFLFIVW